MKRSRFSEEQIIGVLKEGEAGQAVEEAHREPGTACAGPHERWSVDLMMDSLAKGRRFTP